MSETRDAGRGGDMETRDTAPEGATDPWATVKPRDGYYYEPSPLDGRISMRARVYVAKAVDRARAAVEAAHREEIAKLRAEIAVDDQLLADRQRILDACPCPTHGACVPHVLQTLAERDDLAKQVARLTQERDKYHNGFTSSQEQIGLLLAERNALRIQNEQMRQELLDIGAALNDPAENLITTTAQCITRVRAERDALAAQVAGLREALESIARGGPKDGQRVGPMKLYQAQAVARAALAATEGGTK